MAESADNVTNLRNRKIDKKKLEPFMKRIDNLDAELAKETARIKTDINQVYEDCKAEIGIPKEVLKERVSAEREEARRNARLAEFTEEQRDLFDLVNEALGPVHAEAA